MLLVSRCRSYVSDPLHVRGYTLCVSFGMILNVYVIDSNGFLRLAAQSTGSLFAVFIMFFLNPKWESMLVVFYGPVFSTLQCRGLC